MAGSVRWQAWMMGAAMLGLVGCVTPFQHSMNEGQKLANAGKWDEAAQAYEQALAARPTDAKAQAGLRVATWNRSRERALRARMMLDQGDVLGGLKLAGEASAIDSAVPETRQVFDDASRRALEGVEAREKSGQLDEALEWAIAVHTIDARSELAAQAELRVRERIAREAYARAEELIGRHREGNALLAFRRADEVRPGYRDASARATALRDQLANELRFVVRVGQGTGSPLAQSVARGLARWTPEAERPLLATANDDGRAASNEHGVRVNPAFEPVARAHDVATSTRHCSYVCGIDRVPNPDFPVRKVRVAEATRRSHHAQRELARSEDALRDAQSAVDQGEAMLAVARNEVTAATSALSTCRNQQPEPAPQPGPRPPRHRPARQPSAPPAPPAPTAPPAPSARPAPRGELAADCRAQEERLANSQREQARVQGVLDVATAALRRAKARRDEASQAAQTAQAQWNAELALLGQTPPILEQERVCDQSYGVQAHTITARATYALAAEPMGPVRIAPPAPRELVATASDETFAAQADRCAILAGGDPLSLPPSDEMDRRLVGDALAASQSVVRRWYDDDAQRYASEARALTETGRAEEATEATVRLKLLTGAL